MRRRFRYAVGIAFVLPGVTSCDVGTGPDDGAYCFLCPPGVRIELASAGVARCDSPGPDQSVSKCVELRVGQSATFKGYVREEAGGKWRHRDVWWTDLNCGDEDDWCGRVKLSTYEGKTTTVTAMTPGTNLLRAACCSRFLFGRDNLHLRIVG